MDAIVTEHEYEKAFECCRKNLGETWRKAKKLDVNVTRLSGGMSNLLYRCALSEDVHMSNHQEPRCVLLRLYGPAHGDTDIQLEIFRRLADEKLGPKLYAYFEGGRLEEYLPSSPLAWNDMTRYDVSAVIAGKIASIHRLEFECLEGSSDWLLRMYRELNDFILSARESSLPFEKFVQESTKILALDMMRINFSSEINYLSALLQASRAPLVFSHNDLHQNNVIMLHKSEKDETLDDRIVLIDFEYCSYNYRTFDIANHLSEWCFDYNGDEYPHFTASIERFPSEEKQRQFLKHYIKELESDNRGAGLDKDPTFYDGENSLNDKIEILFDEMQPCMMASNLLWAMWAIKSACTSKIKFGYWEMAKWKWSVYLLCKEQYEERTGNKLEAINPSIKTRVQASKM